MIAYIGINTFSQSPAPLTGTRADWRALLKFSTQIYLGDFPVPASKLHSRTRQTTHPSEAASKYLHGLARRPPLSDSQPITFTDSAKMSCDDVVRRCRAKMSCEDVVRRCRAQMSCKDVVQRCRAKMSCEDVVKRCRAKMSCEETGHASVPKCPGSGSAMKPKVLL